MLKHRIRSAIKHLVFGWKHPHYYYDERDAVLDYISMASSDWLRHADSCIVITDRERREIKELVEHAKRIIEGDFCTKLKTEEFSVDMITTLTDNPLWSQVKFVPKYVTSNRLHHEVKRERANEQYSQDRFFKLLSKHLLRLWW